MKVSPEFGSPLPMQEAVRSAPHSILDIGAGYKGVDPSLSGNSVYVGLNIDPRQHAILADMTRVNQFAVYFDLRKLTPRDLAVPNSDSGSEYLRYFYDLFAGCSFDTLGMRDVFGEQELPGHYRYTRVNESGNDYLGASNDAAKLLSLRLGSRLLRRGGTLVIDEFQTPELGLAGLLQSDPKSLRRYGYKGIKIKSIPHRWKIADPYRITAKKA